MSGGSHNYECFRIEEEYVGKMHDRELDDLMADIAKLVYALEWYDSGDTCEKTYRKEVEKFKGKWFKQSRTDKLKGYVDKALGELKKELYQLIAAERTDE